MAPPSQNHPFRAGLYMVLTTASFVCGDTCIKLIGTSLPPSEIVGLTGLISTIFLFIICTQQKILGGLPMVLERHVLLRSAMDMMGSFLFVTALMHTPLANMSAIMQSVPLVVVVFAVIFLGEKASMPRAVAVLAGFIGVLLIVKPAPQTFTLYQFLALATVIVVALRDLVTRRIPAAVPLLIISLANAMLVSLGGLALAAMQGFQGIATWQYALLLGAGVFVALGYVFIVVTMRLGELSATAPFRYSEVVFAIIAGALVFNDYPDVMAYAGMALVIAAGLYAARSEVAQNSGIKTDLMPPAF
jgi:drug/metabolite transporter (DMT)-like permease